MPVTPAWKVGVCPQCGTEFGYYPSSYESGVKTHCSQKCRSKAARTTTTCPKCGKSFEYHLSWPRIYCSRKCSAAVNAKANLGIVELPPMFCEVCGEPIIHSKTVGARFCSQKCFGVHLKQTRTGVPRPDLAGERPDLQKRVDVTCAQCGNVFRVSEVHAQRRRCCSRGCYAQYMIDTGFIRGESNPNWVGGYDPYYGPNWRSQQRHARRRDNHTCQRCGKTETELGRKLDVHHITPFREFGIDRYRDANRLANLVSLCNVCHTTADHEYRRQDAAD